MGDPFLEKVCLPLFHLSLGPVSLWQAAFVAACAAGALGLKRQLEPLPRRTLVLLAVIVAAGAGLRLGLSPRNLLQTNYRGQGQIALAASEYGFARASSIEEMNESGAYYLGYGHHEYLRPFLRLLPGSPASSAFMAGGLAACLHGLLLFALALALFGDARAALWCAGLEALSPAALRLAFGDSVYTFGALPTLLAFFQASLFSRTRSRAALLGALAAGYCAAYTHAAFLPVPLAALLLAAAARPAGARGQPDWLWPAAGVLAALLVPAFAVGTLPFARLSSEYASELSSLGYGARVLSFLASGRNPLFDPAFTPPLTWALLAAGVAALALRGPKLLAAGAGAVLLLELPVVFVSGTPHAALVKHAHILPLYLLAAGYGAAFALERLGKGRRAAAAGAALAAGLAVQPLAWRNAITGEYNLQKEFSFLRRALADDTLDKEVFVFGNGAYLMEILRPGRHAGLVVNEAPARPAGGPQAPDDARVLRYLDCRLAEKARPLLYLPLRCWYAPPGAPGTGAALLPECARFTEGYRLEPVTEESFESRTYCPETDRAGSGRVTIGFYRILGPARTRRAAGQGQAACRDLLAGVSLGAGAPGRAPTPREALLDAMARRLASGKPRQALSLARDLTRRFPEDPAFWLARARAERASGEGPAAGSSLEKAFAASRGVEELRAVALERQESGDRASALELLRSLARAQPWDATLLRDRGVCEALSGDTPAALKSLERAVELDPRLLSAHLSLGSLHAAAGRSAQARAAFEKGLSVMDPEEPELLEALRDARAALR